MATGTRYTNLTRYESIGINKEFNLADGHAHQGQNATQQEIVAGLPEIFYSAEKTLQAHSEDEFQQAFFTLAGQQSAVLHPRTFLCYSASLAIDLVATYLSTRNLTVSLLQPCFDNLATILQRRNVHLTPVEEDDFAEDRLDSALRALDTDALFLTLPNNPTGFDLSLPAFRRVVDYCRDANKILIIDRTFRFFVTTPPCDHYDILEKSGVSYAVMEDTGKTWPTQDLKCSILAVSEDLHPDILELHNDILLNVSPFILQLLTRYIQDTHRNGLDATIWSIIRANRAALRAALSDSIFVSAFPDSTVSVEWVRIDHADLRSEDVVEALGKDRLGILPGDHFYWADHRAGSQYVRFALARPPDWFAEACHHLRAVIQANADFRA
ncbi:aminotransferase class I/II-fold pyridoxal phosphate-dependent enzyme [Micromonospora okii]|uniref:aminotransferase class I/II-fold pyridoxal phosphate-dependent enzyme n=1 Tax=Micromonospora okii TaxID=1182970 RepID=UPI001E2B53AD|nr:aminotransferase class I/II-fold pyridoxal phosphate-dependent enzyme [Micromonospora okii]